MNPERFPAFSYPEEVVLVERQAQQILLVGTAHISQHSVDLVQQVIEQEQPDLVCIELDEKRYAALARPQQWENLDLRQVIRNKQLATLMVSLVLSSYQKKLGGQLGVQPGKELLTAAQTAERHGIPIELCDRDVRITLRRAWKATSFFKKGYLLATLLGSLFDKTELDEKKLAQLRQKDALSDLMDEIGTALPAAKTALIDERDIFMAEKIKAAPGSRIVAVVGAGHLAGIEQALQENHSDMMTEISTIPPISGGWKVLGWAIPLTLIAALVGIGFQKGLHEMGANVLYWVLANGIPSAIGALLAFAHPATVFSAFAAAPLTSLTPVIGAGYVCAFVQVMTQPPVVKEFEAVSQDIGSLRGWWRNKLLRVFLVFILTGLGSSIGTWVGGYRIFTTLFA